MSSSIKKRRVGGGGSSGDNDIGGGASVSEELKDIKSTISEMCCMMKGMHNDMKDMRKDMNGMKKDITKLTKKCGSMEKSIEDIDERFDDVEDKLGKLDSRFISRHKDLKVLLKNQKWEYSVPRPSEDYWDNLDTDEHTNAEIFLTEIKTCTEKLRYGTGNGRIFLYMNIGHPFPYNVEFLPHWKEFASALEQYQYCLNGEENKALSIWGVELPDVVVDLLSESLKSTFFEQFALHDNNFGDEGIKFALDYLDNNVDCIRFSLRGNPMNNIEDIKRLCEAVKRHPSVDTLELPRCKGADIDGYEMLKLIMKAGRKNLDSIDLSNNNISTGRGTYISDFLTTNPILGSLFLDGNNLNDNDATAIASALKHNTELRILELENNNLTTAGWEALSKSLFDKTSLNSAADSNHTCVIDGFPSESIGEGITPLGQENTNTETKRLCRQVRLRQKKVYSVLSARNRDRSNVDHFNDDMSVELLPHMLTVIERYANYHETDEEDDGDAPLQDTQEVKPLSIMFEILQRWDKSLAVFEALSS